MDELLEKAEGLDTRNKLSTIIARITFLRGYAECDSYSAYRKCVSPEWIVYNIVRYIVYEPSDFTYNVKDSLEYMKPELKEFVSGILKILADWSVTAENGNIVYIISDIMKYIHVERGDELTYVCELLLKVISKGCLYECEAYEELSIWIVNAVTGFLNNDQSYALMVEEYRNYNDLLVQNQSPKVAFLEGLVNEHANVTEYLLDHNFFKYNSGDRDIGFIPLLGYSIINITSKFIWGGNSDIYANSEDKKMVTANREAWDKRVKEIVADYEEYVNLILSSCTE